MARQDRMNKASQYSSNDIFDGFHADGVSDEVTANDTPKLTQEIKGIANKVEKDVKASTTKGLPASDKNPSYDEKKRNLFILAGVLAGATLLYFVFRKK